jgi:hypothetical protein
MITQHSEVEMNAKALTAVLAIGVMALVLSACGGEQAVDVKKLMAQQKTYVAPQPHDPGRSEKQGRDHRGY